jgi:uncharacterized protein DUF6544
LEHGSRSRGAGRFRNGELMRFFAKAALYPTALLPCQSMRWQGVDGRSATATMAEGPLNLTLLFRFAPMGREMAWLTPQGRKLYRRGTVTALGIEFAT